MAPGSAQLVSWHHHPRVSAPAWEMPGNQGRAQYRFPHPLSPRSGSHHPLRECGGVGESDPGGNVREQRTQSFHNLSTTILCQSMEERKSRSPAQRGRGPCRIHRHKPASSGDIATVAEQMTRSLVTKSPLPTKFKLEKRWGRRGIGWYPPARGLTGLSGLADEFNMGGPGVGTARLLAPPP